MAGEVFGVRIIPPVLQFFDTVPHGQFELAMTVMNVSKTSKNIRYYGPKSENFSLKVKNPDTAIAPGLAVSATVMYYPKIEREDKDRIVVTVDGNVVEVPVFAHPCQPQLHFTSDVDFGSVVADNKVITKEITITNTGSKKGDFKMKYSGNEHICVVPSSGTVPPHSEQKVKVEFLPGILGKLSQVVDVYLDGHHSSCKLCIHGVVIKRALELLSTIERDKKVDCIKFGSTYYGTDTTECAVLFNNGPDPVSFVAIIDDNAIAQEMGIDLTMTTTAALAEEEEHGNKRGMINVLTSLIAAIPNQGTLKPYQKLPMFFRFSPRWYESQLGWKNQTCPPPRKDFALFMRLQIIGSNHGFLDHEANVTETSRNADKDTYVEVALTGTALPVLLNIYPTSNLDFGQCLVGEHADTLVTIKNESNILPVLFQFQRVAHFNTHPSSGKILPGQAQDVIFSFTPKQVGSFRPEQLLDILGQTTDKINPNIFYTEVIHSLPVQMSGSCKPVTAINKPKFNTGITPQITNEVGLNVETTFRNLKEEQLRNAVAGSTKTKLHRLKNPRKAVTKKDYAAKVAFPNDRALSVRPFDRKEHYKSLFTHVDRYNYTDPDYSYTDQEIHKRTTHGLRYIEELHQHREKRIALKENREFMEMNNNVDLGMKSAAGIAPKKLTLDEVMPDVNPPDPPQPNAEWKVLSTRELAMSETVVTSKKVCEGLNALPSSNKEKRDCTKWLSPQQLYQVIIGPPVIDFGSVCVGSICQKEIRIVNNLEQFVHIVAEIDCAELRQSSPLSQVVPPRSHALIPVIFESRTKGPFQRSVAYTVNSLHNHHVTVQANVVPVSLEMSTTRIYLKPTPGLSAEAGMRGVVTLYNNLNYPAEFTWSPDRGDRGTAFSIRPATGVVEPYTDLDCEVVWHPSFQAPEEGSFTLFINGGESRSLFCSAEVGNTNVYFLDPRVTFGCAAINLTTVMMSVLHNNGSNHAYFQVSDPNPIEGLTISPVHGVVPVGGSAELRVALTPNSIIRFDTKVQVAIRGGKTLELRISGAVDPPDININVSSFNFGGVYCGSSATIPFSMENLAKSNCRIEVDLTKYQDFSITFPGCQSQEDFTFQELNPGMASVTLNPEETIQGEIIFTPKQVAAYDFTLSVTVNYLGSQDPCTRTSATSLTTLSTSTHHIITPKPAAATVTIPKKRLIATAMRQPLHISTKKLEFELDVSSLDVHGDSSRNDPNSIKSILITNLSSEQVTWGFDLSIGWDLVDKGIFKFFYGKDAPCAFKGQPKSLECQLEPKESRTIFVSFNPKSLESFQMVVPITLNSQWDKPFHFLEIVGELRGPQISFDPASIILVPAPLETEVSSEFTILASNYLQTNKISAIVPEIECDDGLVISPLVVTFLQGNTIKPVESSDKQSYRRALQCKVTFSSHKPVSFCQPIFFKDEEGRHYSLPVTATADNCLLSNYHFIALHRADYQIVCEQGSAPKGCKPLEKVQQKGSAGSQKSGEAVLIPQAAADQMKRTSSRSTSSSSFQMTSSYETNNETGTGSDTVSNGTKESSKFTVCSTCESSQKQKSRSTSTALLINEDTEEGMFHMEVLMAVQRWFSYQGWPGGPYPILVPETLRMAISKKTVEAPKSKEDNTSKTQIREKEKIKNVHQKLTKTIYDMISFLSGRSVPGIPANAALSANPVDRVRQIYWQHCTLLTFLRCQGGCVSSILPEFLMMPEDFVVWRQLQKTVQMELMQQGNVKDAKKIVADDIVEEGMFESVSARMWTDVLLQILKVFVLAKITAKSLKSLSIPEKDIVMPTVSPDPLSSNVYSIPERVLLAWMNYHYGNNRIIIWDDCQKGGIPATRWIVNFDFDLMDGLVIASLLGSHMPFLIKSHLEEMYSCPSSAEQCLHNALKVVSALRYVGIDYDIQAIDITDPNPVVLLLLIAHLYDKLPQYIPKTTIEFVGCLHSIVTRQVKVTNGSTKNLAYNVVIAGRDAIDFTVPKGSVITIPAKSTLALSVEFKSRFLRPAEAVLVLIGKRQGTLSGNTLTFNLQTEIDNIRPRSTIKVESPCYELERVKLEITNPNYEGGEFRIVMIESKISSSDSGGAYPSSQKGKDKKPRFQSKTDLLKRKESPFDFIPMNRILEHQETMALKNSQIPTLQAFHAPVTSVTVEAFGAAEVEIQFLPFHVGEHQCSVIFLNEKIGEFVYSIEATALTPLPSYLPYMPNKESARMNSATAEGNALCSHEETDSTIYWKCEAGSMLKEVLLIPVTNIAKERALIIASQQNMSELEMQRRQVTGTIMSCSVTAKALKDLSNNPVAAISLAKAMGPVADVYKVEVDTDYFQVPVMLVMPSARNSHTRCLQPISSMKEVMNLADGVAELTVQFKAKDPGVYPATITLTAIDDVRIYHIECTVTPPASATELEFLTPVHQSITQNIPIMNTTYNDWPLLASISGNWFYGPRTFTARSSSTTNYPLTFRPMKEERITGKLILTNKHDGTEKTFVLTGKGEKPLALDQITLTCGAKASITHTVKVPNVTNKKLTYRVESDLPFISGLQTITVLPKNTGSYNVVITPNKRGQFKGVLAFIAVKSPAREKDSDGELSSVEETDTEFLGIRMWYSLEIDVKPSLPERTVTVVCACHKKTLVEVIVRNPTPKEITLKASIRGRDVTGPLSINLCPGEKDVYTLTFAPSQIGESRGSLIFFNEDVGEFWYNLVLIAEPPTPTTLPHLECELGRWVRQTLTLHNPIDEMVDLRPKLSNTNNFMLELDIDKPLSLKPNSIMPVAFKFVPSALGEGDHIAKITFTSEQFGEWVFIASGTGLLPKMQPPVIASAASETSSTFFVSFRNPTLLPAVVDVYLTGEELYVNKPLEGVTNMESPFTLLLKHTRDIHVKPRSTLEIPVSFAPPEAQNYQAYCTVVVKREDGQNWPSVPDTSPGHRQSSDDTGISKIYWVFPLQGIPEYTATSSSTFEIFAGDKMEQRMEATLTKTPAASTRNSVVVRSRTPVKKKTSFPTSVVVGNSMATLDEYSFELLFDDDDDEAREEVQQSLELSILRHYMEPSTGEVTLVFDVKFSPLHCMDHQVQLLVKAKSGSFWTFPLRFKASEPPVDGTILIEASGLGKPSTTSFTLDSEQKNPSEFKAYFDSRSDPEFSVSPETGQITSGEATSTLFTVTFLPNVYGKPYNAKLIIQTPERHWSYSIKGVLPDYKPPRGVSAPPISGPHPPVKSQLGKKNYIRENLKLVTTAVSSPIKGSHLVHISRAHVKAQQLKT